MQYSRVWPNCPPETKIFAKMSMAKLSWLNCPGQTIRGQTILHSSYIDLTCGLCVTTVHCSGYRPSCSWVKLGVIENDQRPLRVASTSDARGRCQNYTYLLSHDMSWRETCRRPTVPVQAPSQPTAIYLELIANYLGKSLLQHTTRRHTSLPSNYTWPLSHCLPYGLPGLIGFSRSLCPIFTLLCAEESSWSWELHLHLTRRQEVINKPLCCNSTTHHWCEGRPDDTSWH